MSLLQLIAFFFSVFRVVVLVVFWGQSLTI